MPSPLASDPTQLSPLAAQNAVKFSKTDVRYTDDHGDSPEQCSKCVHYVKPITCEIVLGRIRPQGWCNQFRGKK